MLGRVVIGLAGVVATPVSFLAYYAYKRNLLFRSKYVSRIIQENRPSFTAELVCLYRAVGNDLGWCHDPLAYYILDWDARILVVVAVVLKRLLGRFLRLNMFVFMSARTAYLDKFIMDNAPLRQLVILGAGLDARAYRMRRQLGDGIRVFEVDASATQAMKRQKMQTLAREHPEIFDVVDYEKYVSFVSCDFSSESFVDRLKANGFDLGNPRTTVLLEGVASYLTPEALKETLAAVGKFAPGTRMAMNIVAKSEDNSNFQFFLKNIVGEERRNSWDPKQDPSEFFGPLGFKVLENRQFGDLVDLFPVFKAEVKLRHSGYFFLLEVV